MNLSALKNNLLVKADSQLIILMLMVSLPHFEYIPWWSVVIILLLAVWRSIIISKNKYRPGKVISALLTILAAIFIYQKSGGFSGIAAGSHLLVVMAFFKLLESKNRRDYMLLVILSFFIIATNFLFSQSIATAAYMFVCLFFTLVTMISINQKKSDISFKEKSAISLKLIAYSIPLMIVLFLFFPRITGPLWNTDNDQSQAKTGLSDSMEPGQISQLVYSNDLVFRAKFKDKRPAQHKLYWRALTLLNFNGKKWTATSDSESGAVLHINSSGYEYTVTMEASNKKWLYLLDLPYQINNKHHISSDFTSHTNKALNSLIQYTAHSSQNYYISNNLDPHFKSLALNTPDLNKKTRELAERWRQKSTNSEEIINQALAFFTRQGFSYTLSPARLTRANSIDQFLFETREGFCEHYASAFAVLMRHAGIPSRIVLGYLGGELNPIDNILSVNQSMAHSWTEVWIDGKGWIRIDPTAAIAPDRININISTALKDKKNLPLHLQINSETLLAIKQFMSAIDNQWNQWVLNYDETHQKKFLQFLTGTEYSLKDISNLFIQIILITLLLTGFAYFFNNFKKIKDPVKNDYKLFLKKLSKAGLPKLSSEGPRDYKNRLLKHLPAQKQEISFIMENYINLRYKKNIGNSSAERFRKAIRQFRAKKTT